ncbi:MAG: hypothetical protein ABC596_05950 [Candidatus Methanosuratincola petrocarbonis]
MQEKKRKETKKFTPKMARAAELVALGMKHCDIAEELKVTRPQVSIWHRNPQFREEVARIQQEMLKETIAVGKRTAEIAVRELQKIILDKEIAPNVRVSAIRVALEFSAKVYQLDEIEELKQEVEQLRETTKRCRGSQKHQEKSPD